MAFCFMIGVAGGIDSQISALADALCEAYSHRSVIHLKMKDYKVSFEDLPNVILQNGEQCCDEHSPECYDLKRMSKDIEDIMFHKRCRILVVEGSLILWHHRIEELCDVRVYIDGPIDGETDIQNTGDLFADQYDLYRDRHNRYVAPSKEEADITISANEAVEHGVWKIRKALWGLWL